MDCSTCRNDPSQSVVTALVNRNGKCFMEAHPCPTCDGEGTISRDQYERLVTGAKFRADRIEMTMSISQMAVLAGFTPREVSDYEEGRLTGDHSDRVRDGILGVIAGVRAFQKRRSA